MSVTVRHEPSPSLVEYGTVPLSFTTTSILRIEWQGNGLEGIRITEVAVDPPLTKDLDEGEPVSRWLQFGDISHWGFFGAYDDGRRVGGAVVAHRTPTVRMLEGRADLGVLWDIRIAPSHRRRGIGSRLLAAAAQFAWDQGCTVLKVESQNNNPAACRFYAKHHFKLGGVREHANPEFPHETQLLWYLQSPDRLG